MSENKNNLIGLGTKISAITQAKIALNSMRFIPTKNYSWR